MFRANVSTARALFFCTKHDLGICRRRTPTGRCRSEDAQWLGLSRSFGRRRPLDFVRRRSPSACCWMSVKEDACSAAAWTTQSRTLATQDQSNPGIYAYQKCLYTMYIQNVCTHTCRYGCLDTCLDTCLHEFYTHVYTHASNLVHTALLYHRSIPIHHPTSHGQPLV